MTTETEEIDTALKEAGWSDRHRIEVACLIALEREACALEVESYSREGHEPNSANLPGFEAGYACALGDAAAGIRARGNQ